MTDDELEGMYLDALRAGKGPLTAARIVGATGRDMAAYIAAVPDFAARVEEAQAEAMEVIESKVMEAGQAGDFQAARFVLETHKPQEWTKPDREIQVNIGAELDLPALRKRLEAARAKAIDVESQEVDDGD